MTITVQMRTEISQLYVALFGRAPDGEGLGFWVSLRDQGQSLAQIANTMYATTPARAIYPSFMTNGEIIGSFYSNVLGRTADADGLAFWTAKLNTAGATAGSVISEMIGVVANYKGTDPAGVTSAALFNNRVTVAQYYGEKNGNIAGASTVLATVTADAASVTTAKASIDGTVTTGSTFTLTTGLDTLTGTNGNDTFSGVVDYTAGGVATSAATSLNVADTISGGAGTDVLNLTVSGAATGPNAGVTLPIAAVSSVENVNVRAVTGSGQTITVDANTFTGVTSLASDRSSDAVAFTNVAGTTAVGVVGNGVVTNGATTATYAASATAPVLNIGGGTVGTGNITVNAAGATSFAINVTGGANNSVGTIAGPASATSLTINAAADLVATGITGAGLTKITVAGAAQDAVKATVAGQTASAVQIGTVAANVTTIDASGLTAGGVAATLVAGVTSFKGGQGSDTITTATLTATVASQIDAGAGNDTLVVAATADVNSATKAKEFANFETLSIADSQTADASLFTNSAITKIMLGGTTAGVTNLNATQAANIQIFATETTPTISVKDATINGNLDTIKFTFDDNLAATNTISLGAFTAAGVETINVVANDNATLSSLANATALTGMTVTGAGNVSITTAALVANPNTVIDASAVTGTVTLNAASATTNGLKLVGSATKADTITGSAQNDTLIGGAAADTFVTSGGTDIITTGAGGDQITVAAANASVPSSTNFITITDFNKTAGTTTFDTLKAAALILGTQTAAAGAGVATLTSGVATFNAADTTFAQHLAAVAAAQQTVNGATTIWQEGADSYVFISDGTLAVGANDILVKLVGVTAGALTVSGNAITAIV